MQASGIEHFAVQNGISVRIPFEVHIQFKQKSISPVMNFNCVHGSIIAVEQNSIQNGDGSEGIYGKPIPDLDAGRKRLQTDIDVAEAQAQLLAQQAKHG